MRIRLTVTVPSRQGSDQPLSREERKIQGYVERIEREQRRQNKGRISKAAKEAHNAALESMYARLSRTMMSLQVPSMSGTLTPS